MSKARNVQDLIEEINSGANPEFIPFFGYNNGPTSCLSQFAFAKFTKLGVTYLTAEHWMMASKATIFGDASAFNDVLDAKTPAEAKKIGRRVRNFNPQVWGNICEEIVIEGNMLKFQQNPEYEKILLGTGQAVLVEASPYDRLWGIGIDRNHPNLRNPKSWPGKNLLGFCLMEVRDRIAKKEKIEREPSSPS